MPGAPTTLAEARALIAKATATAAAEGRSLAEPPEEPLPDNCCGRGCEHCVYYVYYDALDAWAREVSVRGSPNRPEG